MHACDWSSNAKLGVPSESSNRCSPYPYHTMSTDIVGLTVSIAYQTADGLTTWSIPGKLLWACVTCSRGCLEDSKTCGVCNKYICGGCAGNYVLSDDDKGLVSLCGACARQQPSSICSRSEPNVEIIQSLLENVPRRSSYTFLRKLFRRARMSGASIGKNRRMRFARLTRLNHFFPDRFDLARDVGTWMVLASHLAKTYPRGIVILGLQTERCIVCAPAQAPSQANVDSALSWMRFMGDATVGIVSHNSAFACLSVHYDRRAQETIQHHDVLERAAAEVVLVDF